MTINQNSRFKVRYAFLDEMNNMSYELVSDVSFDSVVTQLQNEKRNKEYAVLGFHFQMIDSIFVEDTKVSISEINNLISELESTPVAA